VRVSLFRKKKKKDERGKDDRRRKQIKMRKIKKMRKEKIRERNLEPHWRRSFLIPLCLQDKKKKGNLLYLKKFF